jgi:hypothetical protein
MSRRGGAGVCEKCCAILAAGRRVNRSSLRVRASRAPRTTANRSTRLVQVGFFQSCGHFTWAGVQDAGHMVPYDRPRAGANARRVSSSPSPSFSFFLLPSPSFFLFDRLQFGRDDGGSLRRGATPPPSFDATHTRTHTDTH